MPYLLHPWSRHETIARAQQQARAVELKFLTQDVAGGVKRIVERAAIDHGERQPVQTVGERVVVARVAEEFAQLALEIAALVAQYLYLTLDQRYRASADLVYERDACEQFGVTLEVIGVFFEVAGDGVLPGNFLPRFAVRLFLTHSPSKSSVPSNTATAGPASRTGLPSPAQETVNVPPGKVTFTVSSSRPRWRPATTAAQAPLPQASVSPAPRSYTRRRMWRRSTTCI